MRRFADIALRTFGLGFQLAVFGAALVGGGILLREIGMRWDDWLVLSVMCLGVLTLAFGVYRAQYPPRSRKRRFGRSSGPDAPAPRAPTRKRRG